MKRLLPVIPVLMIAAACSSMSGTKCSQMNEQLRAENSLMRDRTALLHRENAVLRDENLRLRKNAQELGARVEKLESDILALRESSVKELAMRDREKEALTQKNAILLKESSLRIDELRELNTKVEKELRGEISTLSAEVLQLKDAYSREREALRNAGAQRELALSREIEGLRNAEVAKDEQIAALKNEQVKLRNELDEREKRADKALRESSDKTKIIEDKTAAIEEKDKAIRAAEKENAALRERIAALEREKNAGR